jgi:hypothetical protein
LKKSTQKPLFLYPAPFGNAAGSPLPPGAKVFCFFFSKKKRLLPFLLTCPTRKMREPAIALQEMRMDLRRRSELTELMDAPDLDEASYRRCLHDLASVNRVTFTHRATLRWLARATRDWPAGAVLSVLEVAYGQGDLLRAIARWAERRGFLAHLSGIDLNPRSALAALAVTPPEWGIDYCTGDVFEFLPGSAPDFIVTSQFAHHLTGDEIVRLLSWMEAWSVRGWHITDLHRHAIAYYGFPLLARLMGWHPIVRTDGRISIARAFIRRDWERLLAQAGVAAKISWHMPFRFTVSRLK